MKETHDENIQENKSLFNKWANTYDFSLFQFWMKKFHVPIIRELSQLDRGKILDISCGTGELLRRLKGNFSLYGIDISEEMLEIARNKLHSTIVLKKADVHELPFEDNFFDYVITTEAFHHYYNQEEALREMYRVVKENGKVIVVDINFFLRTIHYIFEKFEPGCVKVNSKKEMYDLFKKTGLKNIKQRRNFVFSMMTSGDKYE